MDGFDKRSVLLGFVWGLFLGSLIIVSVGCKGPGT